MLIHLYAHQFLFFCTVILCSTGITWAAIPSILHVARTRHLYDDLGHFRKQHDHGIPRLGGVAIFVSFTVTVLMFGIAGNILPVNCLISACILLLAMGLKDDLSGVNPSTKFMIQFVVAFILVICGDIRLTNMHGILGLYALPYYVSVLMSMFSIILVINAFNLIDGINGLAATLGILANGIFAAFFIYMHLYQLAAMAIAIVGAVFGFLKFNLTPARIFMGDTGSMLIGLVSVVMGIEFIDYSYPNVDNLPEWFSAPAVTVAVLITPLFDTARVFILRIAAGRSPFTADRSHVHHRMLDLGFTHIQATFTLTGINFFIVLAVLFISVNSSIMAVISAIAICLAFNGLLTYQLRTRGRAVAGRRSMYAEQ